MANQGARKTLSTGLLYTNFPYSGFRKTANFPDRQAVHVGVFSTRRTFKFLDGLNLGSYTYYNTAKNYFIYFQHHPTPENTPLKQPCEQSLR